MSILIAPIAALEEVLSLNTGFQAFAGVSNSSDALDHIYRDFLPQPADGDQHTLAELVALRPWAMIWTQESQGWQANRVASDACFRIGGSLLLRLERSIDPAHTDQQAAAEFDDLLSGIIHNDQGDGLIQAFTRLNIHHVSILGKYRSLPEHLDTLGDCYSAELLIRWGLQ